MEDALAELASPDSPPAGGVAAALTCATAAALVELSAGLAAKRVAADGEDATGLTQLGQGAGQARKRMLEVADEDVQAYGRVMAGDAAGRAAALASASEPPLEVAEAAAVVAVAGARVAAAGEWAFTADALVAARLAAAAAASAAELVAANLAGGAGPDGRVAQAREAAQRAARAAG